MHTLYLRTLKASPLQSVMLRPLRTLMSSTAISPQLFASTKLSITTLKKSTDCQLFFIILWKKRHRYDGWYSTKAQAVRRIKFVHLVRFVGSWNKDTTFPPAIALVTTDCPQQDVSWSVCCLFALFYMQCANVWPKHMVPKRHTEVWVRGTDHRTDQASHLGLLRTCC